MEKKFWKTVLAVMCIASLFIVSSGTMVLAEEPWIESDVLVSEDGDEELVQDDLIENDSNDSVIIDKETSITDGVGVEQSTDFSYEEKEGDISADSEMEAENNEAQGQIYEDDRTNCDWGFESGVTEEELVAATGPWTVGDGVTAKIVVEGDKNVLFFYSKGGTLWPDWRKKIGAFVGDVSIIRVSDDSTKMYLPEDSNSIFSYSGLWTEDDGNYFLDNLEEIDLKKVDTSSVENMSYMFDGLGIEKLDISEFDTSNVTKMDGMFSYCYKLKLLDVSNFNTSHVTSMEGMFNGCNILKLLDVSNFDTSNVTNTADMFLGCEGLKSLDVSGFNTSKVENMSCMFSGCKGLESLDLVSFNTSKVINMYGMFYLCERLKELNLSGFNTEKVTSISGLFYNCSSLINLDISGFDTSNIEYSEYDGSFLEGCTKLKQIKTPKKNTCAVSLPVSMYDVSGKEYTKLPVLSKSITLNTLDQEENRQWTVGDNVTAELVAEGDKNVLYLDSKGGTLWNNWRSIIGEAVGDVNIIKFKINSTKLYFPQDSSGLFLSLGYEGYNDYSHHFKYLESIDLGKVDTSKVTNMNGLFLGCSGLSELDVSNFDTRQVTNMNHMFAFCSGLDQLDIRRFDTSGVSSFTGMFLECSGLTSLDVSSFNTACATNMNAMFSACKNLKNLDVKNFNTSKVTHMGDMFSDCENLSSLDLSGFNTSKADSMMNMFGNCKNLTQLNVSGFNTSNVGTMSLMFYRCKKLKDLDVSKFDTSGVRDMWEMFYGCSSLTKLDLRNFKTSGISYLYNMEKMFAGCSSLTELDISGFDTTTVHRYDSRTNGSLFDDRVDLKYLKTPKKNDCTIKLPVLMSDDAGNDYTHLPMLSESIILRASEKVDISKASVAGVSLSYGYSGKAYTPAMTLTLNGETLTKDTDYTVKYEDNKDPGTAVITITGKGKYTGKRIKTFEIVECVSSVVSGKTYQLIPKNNSKTAVCSFSGRMVNNTKVYITDRSSSEAMKFKAVKNSDGTWKFINAKCELALAVQQNSSEVGKGLVLYDQTTRKAQNWNLSKKSDNSFAIMNAVTGYSIAMSDASAVKGTVLSMAETVSSGLQRFYIAETKAVSAPFTGTHAVKASKDKSFALNIASSSKEDGANVNLYSYSNTNAKKFRFMYSGGGYYRLVNVNSGLVLTVKGNTQNDGANVIQSKWMAADGQRWKITKNSDGTVTMKNALGKILHLTGNKTANGTNVISKNVASTKAQRWYLE